MPETPNLDYYLVIAAGSDNLAKKVQEKLDDGYVLYGDPVLSQVYAGTDDEGEPVIKVLVGQAVVFDEEED